MAPLGERLRIARTMVPGLSARELDRLAGRTECHANLIETRPDMRPTTGVLADYARVLGCSLDWLVLGSGEAPSVETVQAAVATARAQQSSSLPGAA